jgi:hypothetical protein
MHQGRDGEPFAPSDSAWVLQILIESSAGIALGEAVFVSTTP